MSLNSFRLLPGLKLLPEAGDGARLLGRVLRIWQEALQRLRWQAAEAVILSRKPVLTITHDETRGWVLHTVGQGARTASGRIWPPTVYNQSRFFAP